MEFLAGFLNGYVITTGIIVLMILAVALVDWIMDRLG